MNKLIGAAAVIGCVIAGWQLLGRGDSPADRADDQLVLDRIWIDHMPAHDRDTVRVFVAITDEPFGVFQAASAWQGNYEVFRYEAHGGELRVVYPQSGARERVRARASACSAPGFDYCLELAGTTRGVARYYSREEWVVGSARTPAALAARAAEVGALPAAK
jgi:hypothetical protein